jgi:hypothetical protein
MPFNKDKFLVAAPQATELSTAMGSLELPLIVQKYGGTSIGKYPVQIAEIVR